MGGWNSPPPREFLGVVALVSVEMSMTLRVKVTIVIVPLFLPAAVFHHSISNFTVTASYALSLSNGLHNSYRRCFAPSEMKRRLHFDNNLASIRSFSSSY